MIRSITLTLNYNYFEPGTYVVATDDRCAARAENTGELFRVKGCIEPRRLLHPEKGCLVELEGVGFKVNTQYLREATPEEIEKGRAPVTPLSSSGYSGSCG